MAEGYDNTNTFVLYRNDKDGNEARPDYTGTIELEGGTKFRLAAWVKEPKSGGNKFLSGRVSEIRVATAVADDDF
jgi:hypothetical protein